MDAHRSVTPDPLAPRVLVVEDEPEMAGILIYTLEDEGFLVTVARDGIQALQRLEAEPADLVVLDSFAKPWILPRPLLTLPLPSGETGRGEGVYVFPSPPVGRGEGEGN